MLRALLARSRSAAALQTRSSPISLPRQAGRGARPQGRTGRRMTQATRRELLIGASAMIGSL